MLFKLNQITRKYKKGLYTASSSFLVGMFVNTLSSPELSKSLGGIIENVFCIESRPFNVISWITVAILIIIPLLEIISKFHLKKQEKKFTLFFTNNITKDIYEYSKGKWAIGSSITISQAPFLREGWRINRIIVKNSTETFSFNKKYQPKYDHFFTSKYDDYGFVDDGKKFMLKSNPISFTDSPTLNMEVVESKYSKNQFYKECIKSECRDSDLKQFFENERIDFPHSLCLHLIIILNDKNILITKRRNKAGYYPSKWSVSIEEQLDEKDFQDGDANVITRLVNRTMKEELGIENDEYKTYYSLENFRLLSIFLESDIMNISLCGLLKLDLNKTDLNNELEKSPREDIEFNFWDYLSLEQLKTEFVNPSKKEDYHPTSRYRMLMALLYELGPKELKKTLKECV